EPPRALVLRADRTDPGVAACGPDRRRSRRRRRAAGFPHRRGERLEPRAAARTVAAADRLLRDQLRDWRRSDLRAPPGRRGGPVKRGGFSSFAAVFQSGTGDVHVRSAGRDVERGAESATGTPGVSGIAAVLAA